MRTGQIVVAGGTDAAGPMNSVEMLDVASGDGWQSMVEGVADVLRNAGVDRRRLTTQQNTTREGRNHLVQPAVLRTAKHAALNPGTWSAFTPVLEEWLGSLLVHQPALMKRPNCVTVMRHASRGKGFEKQLPM